jgi:DNA-binding transcriptional LysR family regulator
MDKLPDVEAMALFAKVAETGSFARTAEAYGLSKGTVSKAIARLEVRLGARLFHRSSRRLALSETGQTLLVRASRILAEAEAAESEAAAQSASPRGKVRLAAPMSFGLKHLGPALPEFLVAYPEVELDVHLDDRRIDLVAGGFDLALRIGTLEDSSLVARRLCGVKLHVVGAPGYLERRGRPQRPADLKGHACLSYSYLPSADVWRFTGPDGVEESVRVAGPLVTNNGDAIVASVCAGVGLALQPDFIVYEDVAAGRLEVVLSDWAAASPSLNLVSPPGRQRPPKVAVLAEFWSAGSPPGGRRGAGRGRDLGEGVRQQARLDAAAGAAAPGDTILRRASAHSRGRTVTGAPSISPASTAICGRKLTPSPEPTIWTRVCSELAAKASSPRGASTPQPVRACSRRQWPSSSRIISSPARRAAETDRLAASGWPCGRRADSSSSTTAAQSRPAVS